MRDWLATARLSIEPRPAETAETAESPPFWRTEGVSAVSAVSAAALDIEERAAIAEYDGGLPRPLAEALARMEACPPTPGTSPRRWQGVQDSFAMLVATGAASRALATGWTPQDLCGVSSRPPHDRPDIAGLIFSLRPGDSVRGVSRNGCIIVSGTVRHIWKRCPLPADGSICLPWELR